MVSEKETKKRIIDLARQQGCEDKVTKIIQKYEDLIKGVRTEQERQQLAALGIVELHRTVGCVGALVIDGQEIIPEDTSYQEEIGWHKGCTKLD